MKQLGQSPSQQPLHRKIYGELRQEIAKTKKPGDVLESQNELSRRFGVSFPTIREALSILAEEGVIERRRGSGTIVVDPHHNQHIAVLSELDVTHPRTGYHFRRLTQQLRQWFDDQGYRVRLYIGRIEPGSAHNPAEWESTGSSCPEFIEELEARHIRGVVAVAGISRVLLRRLHELGVPVVGNDTDPYSVNTNITDIVHMGIDHLLSIGRRKLAFMSWGDPRVILDAMRDRGLQLNVQWLRTDLPPDSPGAGWEEFREIWSAPGQEKPDGLLVTDDVLFGDALHAIIDAHVRVPQELAIVTHMSGGAGYWAPFPVTRLETEPDVMAAEMGRMLTGIIAGQTPEQPKLVLPIRLVPTEQVPDKPAKTGKA